MKPTLKTLKFKTFPGDKDTRVCGLSDMPCYYDVMLLFEMEDSNVPEIDACGCLADCNLIEYEIDVVETDLKPEEKWNLVNNSYYFESVLYSGLSFAFGDIEYQAIKRYTNHETIIFISNVGGLLGLFLGVSFMTLVEIFYFFVIRVLVELVRFFRKRKQITKIGGADLRETLRQLDY